jgi:L-ribulose-5-phosphate 3-epimerase
MPLAEKFALLKRLGFDGVEPESPSALSRDEILAAKAASGLEIPGVVDSVHWEKTLGDPDPKVRSAGIDGLLTALDDAKAFGASSVLLVPAVVNKKIAYADAYARSQAALREVLPKAAELGIQIALENVWNNFLLSPLEFARYVDELESPWLRVHFDPGNVVRYGWPEQWVGVLGKRIAKMDVKDFLRAPKKKTDGNGQWSGFSVPLLEGDTDWPAVVAALDAIGYHDEAAGIGWYTAEIEGGDEKWLADVAARMDRILAS